MMKNNKTIKNQDKIDEMIEIVNEGLEKNLINKKWEFQKKLLSPLIPGDKKEIDDIQAVEILFIKIVFLLSLDFMTLLIIERLTLYLFAV